MAKGLKLKARKFLGLTSTFLQEINADIKIEHKFCEIAAQLNVTTGTAGTCKMFCHNFVYDYINSCL